MSALERLRAGSSGVRPRMRTIWAAPKPWPEKGRVPFQGDGDPDGDDNGAYEIDPGETEHRTPDPDPDGDHLNLRASLAAAAEGHKNPETARALLAIDARLAEISLFLRSARAGTPPEVIFKLDVLEHIICA